MQHWYLAQRPPRVALSVVVMADILRCHERCNFHYFRQDSNRWCPEASFAIVTLPIYRGRTSFDRCSTSSHSESIVLLAAQEHRLISRTLGFDHIWEVSIGARSLLWPKYLHMKRKYDCKCCAGFLCSLTFIYGRLIVNRTETLMALHIC
jgi:hypothetical protein